MKTLRRFFAVLAIATVAFVWTGCDEDEDLAFGGLPFAGGAWMGVPSVSTNAVVGGGGISF